MNFTDEQLEELLSGYLQWRYGQIIGHDTKLSMKNERKSYLINKKRSL